MSEGKNVYYPELGSGFLCGNKQPIQCVNVMLKCVSVLFLLFKVFFQIAFSPCVKTYILCNKNDN